MVGGNTHPGGQTVEGTLQKSFVPAVISAVRIVPDIATIKTMNVSRKTFAHNVSTTWRVMVRVVASVPVVVTILATK